MCFGLVVASAAGRNVGGASGIAAALSGTSSGPGTLGAAGRTLEDLLLRLALRRQVAAVG